MPRYFTGDELGSIKSVSFERDSSGKEWQTAVNSLLEGSSSNNRSRAIQKLALASNPDNESEKLLAAARADGSASVFHIKSSENTALREQSGWQENRLKQNQKFVGLSIGKRGVYSCTSNGALRLTTPINEDHSDAQPDVVLAALPTRLAEWRLASNEQTFAYAGDEVELSVWDTERAFLSDPVRDADEDKDASASRKRKRTEQLLPAEVWRAKNLPNDNLNLRQPVRNTAFTYLQTSATPSLQSILVGTQFGDVRRYDTRAARRPVSNWIGIGKTGGIGVIENGMEEHQAFVSDHGSNLYALDLRNGKISFGYKGFSGAVTSIAVSPSFLASNAEDRYVRLHSTFPPPAQVGQQQEHKGEVLEKAYVKVVPTVILWDGVHNTRAEGGAEEGEDEGDDDEVWNKMENAESDDEHTTSRKKTRAK